MAETINIPWNIGDGNITATYTGSGNNTITITSTENEGIDREQIITVETTNKQISESITVSQEGLREVFACADGDFILADGGTFNVLKGEEGGVKLISFTIGHIPYQAEEGMTWGEWVNSEYNTDGYYLDYYDSIFNPNIGLWVGTDEYYVFPQDIIIEGYAYGLIG